MVEACSMNTLFINFVDCGDLTDPASKCMVRFQTTFGSVATYSCYPGFTVIGNSVRTCQANGAWSGKAPVCESKLTQSTGGLVIFSATGQTVYHYNSNDTYRRYKTCSLVPKLPGPRYFSSLHRKAWEQGYKTCVVHLQLAN